MTITLHPADARDLGDIMRLMDDAFDPAWGEAWTRAQCLGILAVPGVWMTIARAPDRLGLGFALSRIVLDEAELLLLAVTPLHRGRGIGRLLLDGVTRTAATRGAVRLHLEARDGNDAVHLYQSAGFAEVGRRRAYYRGRDGRQFDAITLSRAID